ncbi:FAD-dependent oxidoreductase [Nonomuraea sp. PA05]|uniref:FAD-dependent oxidoreductase n=1 Tax=Nonomuraea sp. PA05 TaxID=2604466 RepID=UPI0011D94580|nr:FAD-dependent oxidoreductase [Nonomuraea sp. PA05]TYB50776.1 FAD-dependent oxidoreductase [Nonomuraea sp. PA05]
MTAAAGADVVVVGAGPSGCAAALALAGRGARVLLLEAEARPVRRFAGEWLHPPGVAALRRLGVELPASRFVAGAGFVVFPDDGGPAITLPYARGRTGLSFPHSALVRSMRSAVAAHPRIVLSTGSRVTGISGGHVTYTAGLDGTDRHVTASRIIGADGRTSLLRPAAPAAADAPGAKRLSRLAGVLLRDVWLPAEGYGHVFLGGPGPILAYRLNASTVRLCVDVPLTVRPADLTRYLAQRYEQVLRAPLHAAMVAALCRGETQWSVNRFQPRRLYGREPHALVGDAVGHFHPLTAAGLTLAVLDGERVAASGTIADYARERAARSRVPEMLADALYTVFTSDAPAEVALRRAVYALWRRDRAERERTMRLLSTDETRPGPFAAAFLRVARVAAGRLARDVLTGRRPRHPLGVLRGLLAWLRRLAGLAFRRQAAACPPPSGAARGRRTSAGPG